MNWYILHWIDCLICFVGWFFLGNWLCFMLLHACLRLSLLIIQGMISVICLTKYILIDNYFLISAFDISEVIHVYHWNAFWISFLIIIIYFSGHMILRLINCHLLLKLLLINLNRCMPVSLRINKTKLFIKLQMVGANHFLIHNYNILFLIFCFLTLIVCLYIY